MSTNKSEKPLKKVCIICSKGTIEDVYATLVMGNGAVMEGIEAKLFFTFFGLDAITKKQMNKLHTSTVGNPAMRMPGGLPFPTILGMLPGVEAGVSVMMKKQMEEMDLPTVREMMEMLDDAGAELYGCELAMEMMKREKEELIPQVRDIITAGDFYDMSEGAQIIFT